MKIPLEDPNIISIATKFFLKGSIVVFPTDTCYGLGTISLKWNEKNIRQIYKIKNRPMDKPLSLLITKKMISEFIDPNPRLQEVLNHIWPSRVTIVLPCSKTSSQQLSNIINVHNSQKLAFRVPKHQKLLDIIDKIDNPIIGTSANKSGAKSKYDLLSIYQELPLDKIHLWIDGGRLPETPPSTIIDLSDLNNPFIIRKGDIDVEKILTSIL